MKWKYVFFVCLLTVTVIVLNTNAQDNDENTDTKENNYESEIISDETDTNKDNSVQPELSSTNNDSEMQPEIIDEKILDPKHVPIVGSSGSRSGNLMNDMDFEQAMAANNPAEDNSNYDWSNMNNRLQPSEPQINRNDGGYTITPERLTYIRNNFMYWYYDQGGPENQGDYVTDIHASIPQVHKNFNFQMPFFGFRFNYTRISMHGYLEFSDPPSHYTYPLVFPIKDWPKVNDPSFIGIFFSKTRIGKIYDSDEDRRLPGVYFRQERDLMTRTDRIGVEVKERVKWDIRLGVVGADTFEPKHVVIVTWKNMSFAGGIDNSLFRTNTFQMVLATDEVYTYAIFNYARLTWSAHTEAGGDTTGGEGGVPAYIGFNAGNGTQAYEYKPYSQASVLRDLTGRGWANGFPGRHIFRIDEKIMLGTCNKDIDAAHLPLVFAPESGNMLGGTVVNITGPCFNETERVLCRFDTEEVVGHVIDKNRAICVQPFLMAQGYIRFEIAIGVERFKWRGRYFVETPATATDRIFFETGDVHLRAPAEIKISWNQFNLTTNLNAGIRISLWGYRESTIRPQLEYIDMIDESIFNTGTYTIAPMNYKLRDNSRNVDMQFGFLQINLTNPVHFSGSHITPVLWSKPIPLGWYFGPQWERRHGRNWPRALCDNWFMTDRFLRNFAGGLPQCPCILKHALHDKGRFMPDWECDKDSNPTCLHHKGAIHCVRSGTPSGTGAEQQCCYDRNNNLMLSYDQMWGSRPRRNHNIGQMPWNEANKVPTLSTWWNDVRPYYSCCLWQDEQAVGCETFRFERRPSQDCISYQAPGIGAIFGDPHILTFDGLPYTFNGMGEFVLVRGNNGRERIDVQGRFEQAHRNIYGPVNATILTSVAARGNTSVIIEVRLRPPHAQWRYRLDVFADNRRIYFDRSSLKFQHFDGVTVYTPTYILNQSEVVIMFSSGVGVEVVENNGFMTARVYTPWSFINKTRGLFGNWSFDTIDDFVRPDGQVMPLPNLNDFRTVHTQFAMLWALSDREQEGIGAAMFTREFGKTASSYADASFKPNFIRDPVNFIPPNRTSDVIRAADLCGDSYQCRFDYGMSLNRDMAHFTRNYYDSAVNIRKENEQRVISCGVLETPRFGRKSTFLFVPGTRVGFECNQGFFLIGDSRRVCGADGKWDTPDYGYTECLREVFYTRRTAWITIGIILAVIAPIMMCIVCGVYCYRKKQLKDDPNWRMPVPSRSGSRATLRNLNSDGSDMDPDGTMKKSRSYDKVYRTNEPLEGKPNQDFPEKKWDLEDEDVTSSEGSEFRDTKLAKEIEFLNKDDRPKQTGRRSLRLGSDYRPIEEEPNNFPSPIDSPVNYSPTYSGVDRNSSFMNDPKQQQGPSGAVRVLPTQYNDNNNKFFGGSTSPPPPHQDIGLPRANSRSTEV